MTGSSASPPTTTSGAWARPVPAALHRDLLTTATRSGGPPGSADEDGDRFIEIWNPVFMQFEQFEDGSMRDLDMQSIDTGMGWSGSARCCRASMTTMTPT